jgi:hypothetical protein
LINETIGTGELVRTFGPESNKVVLWRDNLSAFPDCFLLVYIVVAFKGQLSLHSEKKGCLFPTGLIFPTHAGPLLRASETNEI